MSVTVLKRLRVKVLDTEDNPTNLLTQLPNNDIGRVEIVDADDATVNGCCRKIDGGAPDTVYLPWQNVDGGSPDTVHYEGQKYDGGLMTLGKHFDGGLLTLENE